MHDQHEPIETFREWNRYLVGFSFAAGSGCIVVFLGGSAGLPRVFLLAAIITFALCALSSMLLAMMLVSVVERLPPHDDPDAVVRITNCRLPVGCSVGTLSWLQFGLLVLAVIFLVVWVLLQPVPA